LDLQPVARGILNLTFASISEEISLFNPIGKRKKKFKKKKKPTYLLMAHTVTSVALYVRTSSAHGPKVLADKPCACVFWQTGNVARIK